MKNTKRCLAWLLVLGLLLGGCGVKDPAETTAAGITGEYESAAKMARS